MNKRKLPPATDWQARDIDDWNVRTFHAYLADRNRELFGAEYVPFGRGSISQRWRVEQGQLKNAITTHGQALVKAFIDRCLARHKPTADFPHVNWGYMWAYMRDEMPRAQAELERELKFEERREWQEEDIIGWL